MMTPSQLIPYLPLMPKALAWSSQQKPGVYDCLYVSLAIREQCHLVTADQRLINKFPEITISLDDF